MANSLLGWFGFGGHDHTHGGHDHGPHGHNRRVPTTFFNLAKIAASGRLGQTVANISRETLTFARDFCDNTAFGIKFFQINALGVQIRKLFWAVAKVRSYATTTMPRK